MEETLLYICSECDTPSNAPICEDCVPEVAKENIAQEENKQNTDEENEEDGAEG